MKLRRLLRRKRAKASLAGGWTVALTGLIVHLSAMSAWAQKPAVLPGEDKGWLQLGIGAGVLIVICMAAFINPKRSHLS